MRTSQSLRRCVLLTAMLAACDHSTPFHSGEYGPEGPLLLGFPTRLTFNPGQDLVPNWMAGDTIVYTAERIDRADHDRCLAFLPGGNTGSGGGGAVSRYNCPTIPSDDSINV